MLGCAAVGGHHAPMFLQILHALLELGNMSSRVMKHESDATTDQSPETETPDPFLFICLVGANQVLFIDFGPPPRRNAPHHSLQGDDRGEPNERPQLHPALPSPKVDRDGGYLEYQR